MTKSHVSNLMKDSELLELTLTTANKEEGLEFQKIATKKILNSISDAILVIDSKNYKILSANEAALKELKSDKEHLIGKPCYEATHHRSTPCIPPNDVCPIQEMLKTKSSVTVEHKHFNQKNLTIDVEVTVHPIEDKDGKIVQVVHIERDITERRIRERTEKIKANEIREIINGIGDLLFVIDKNRIITMVNKATCEAFNKKPEELVGKPCYEIVHGTKTPWGNCPATQTFRTKQIVTEEINDPHLGKPFLVTTSPILDDQDEIAQVVHIAKDMTKIKLAETELQIAANLFESASDSILVHDLDGKLVYFNQAAYRSRGYTEAEFQSLTVKDLEVPDKPRFFGDRMKDLLEKGEAIFESENLCKDNKVMPVEIHAQVIESFGTKMILSVARDISERKATEEKIRETQEKYEITFESSMDALMLLDEKSFIDCNAETLRLFGVKSVNEFILKHPADLSPTLQPDGSPSLESAKNHIMKALWSGKENFFWVHKRMDGTTFPAEVLLSRITLKNRNILQATVRDITERKAAEDRLREAEEKHRSLLSATNVLVQSVDKEGKLVFVNEEWKKVMGYTSDDLEKITINNVVRKDHFQFCMDVFGQVMTGVCVRDVETVFVSKTGKEIVVSGNACPIYKDGKFVSTVAFFVDITERKKNEEKLKESSQRIELMNEKLRVVGSLTRHDVRNKLSTVTGYAYLLKKKHPDQIDVVEGLSKMEQSVKDSMRIFDFAKMYEQIGVEELKYIDVEKAINEAVELFSGLSIKVVNNCGGLKLMADSFLRQLFYNFIDNTRKYGQTTTSIRIYYEKTNQDSLKLIYEDDGVGISSENKLNLFKEGFSTGGSTGFGLFLTKKMMDVYGWAIEENGKPGEGVRFSITVPKLSKNGKESYQIS